MREIKFRGKVKYNGNHYFSGDLVYGYFLKDSKGDSFIIDTVEDEFGNTTYNKVLVENEPIEQYTGLKDKNGTEIYEGDIVLYEADHKIRISDGKKMPQHSYRKYLIGFDKGCFTSSIIEQENSYYDKVPSAPSSVWHTTWENLEIIGNIHEEL